MAPAEPEPERTLAGAVGPEMRHVPRHTLAPGQWQIKPSRSKPHFQVAFQVVDMPTTRRSGPCQWSVEVRAVPVECGGAGLRAEPEKIDDTAT
jgi:hypothetical protein